MISGFNNSAIKNINHTLDVFLSNIVDDYDSIFSQQIQQAIVNKNATNDTTTKIDDIVGTSCVTNFDIDRLIPNWVVAEKSDRTANGETNLISVFDFLQKYYDWLYCDGPDGAQYSLSSNLLDVIDVQKTKEEYLKRIYKEYFTSFPYDAVRNNPRITFDLQNARDFIVSIRNTLHKRKTNREAIRYFFTKLFSIDENDILIYFPKVEILRLNGGRFNNQYFEFPSTDNKSNILPSTLNNSRFQDNDWFHDWSYLVYLGHTQDNQPLKQAYVESLHPAGLRLIFGKQISDYHGAGYPDEDSRICEYPMLKNYAPYAPTLSYSSIGGWYGITLYGLSGCSGCNGTFTTPTATGFTGPTYVLPTWAGISERRFFDINILNFIYLCIGEGITSPNENKNCKSC